jgi:alkylhydroperoxidase family enzyme
MRTFDDEAVIELVRWIQLKNYRAYISHKKKRAKGLQAVPY